jgi:hypothetical protein
LTSDHVLSLQCREVFEHAATPTQEEFLQLFRRSLQLHAGQGAWSTPNPLELTQQQQQKQQQQPTHIQQTQDVVQHQHSALGPATEDIPKEVDQKQQHRAHARQLQEAMLSETSPARHKHGGLVPAAEGVPKAVVAGSALHGSEDCVAGLSAPRHQGQQQQQQQQQQNPQHRQLSGPQPSQLPAAPPALSRQLQPGCALPPALLCASSLTMPQQQQQQLGQQTLLQRSLAVQLPSEPADVDMTDQAYNPDLLQSHSPAEPSHPHNLHQADGAVQSCNPNG